MADVQYGVTKQGFIRKPLDVIISDLNAKFVAEFGESFDTTPESPDGQIIGIVADALSAQWDLALAAYNSYRPGAVNGIGLDNLVELNRVTRRVNVPTTVTCELDGDEGLVVPAGSIVEDVNGNQFTTNRDTTLPGNVTVTCTETGEIAVSANSVTKIVSTLDGWDSVNNKDAGTTGVIRESDAALRVRREQSTIITGTNTAEAVYDALAELGLEYVRVRDNDTSSAVGDQPAKSFHTVVVGGADYDIAQAIYDNKPAGIEAYGTTIVSVTDSKGYEHDIGFSRPTNKNIYVSYSYTRYSGSSNDTEDTINTAILNYINSLPPGRSVAWSQLITVAQLAGMGNVEIDSLTLGTAASPTGMTTITMDITDKPYSQESFLVPTDNTNS